MLSTFLTGLMTEHGCTKFDEVVVDRACLQFDSRHFSTLPLSSTTTLNSTGLLSGSQHSNTRWESNEPVTLSNIMSFDFHHRNHHGQTLLPVLRKRLAVVNNTTSFHQSDGATESDAATTSTTVKKKSGIPSCPIRKLSRESSLSQGGERADPWQPQRPGSSGTESRRLSPWKCPLGKQGEPPSLAAFDLTTAATSHASTTAFPAFQPPRRPIGGETAIASKAFASAGLPNTSPSLLATFSRPPLSPKKKSMVPSATAPATSTAIATATCPTSNGAAAMETAMAVIPKSHFGIHNDRVVGLPIMAVMVPPPAIVRSSFPFALQGPETTHGGSSDSPPNSGVPSSVPASADSASGYVASASRGVADNFSDIFSGRRSPRSITDSLGRPNTGRSLSKTLGVDFQETAPVQPMRRPSAEPEHHVSTLELGTSVTSFGGIPTLSDGILRRSTPPPVVAGRVTQHEVRHRRNQSLPHGEREISSLETHNESLTLSPSTPSHHPWTAPCLHFLPSPLEQVSEDSSEETSSTVSTLGTSNHNHHAYSPSFAMRSATGTHPVKFTKAKGCMLSALNTSTGVTAPAGTTAGLSMATHQESVRDIVFEPIATPSHASHSSRAVTDLPFQYPNVGMLEHPCHVNSNVVAHDTSSRQGRIACLALKQLSPYGKEV